jgi:hypothetical protein
MKLITFLFFFIIWYFVSFFWFWNIIKFTVMFWNIIKFTVNRLFLKAYQMGFHCFFITKLTCVCLSTTNFLLFAVIVY